MNETRNSNRRRRFLLLNQGSSGGALTITASAKVETMSEKTANLFRTACGAPGPIALLVTQPDVSQAEQFSFETPFVLIGRSHHADLRLVHPDVSIRHAYLQVVGGRIFCIDLESRTGTQWEGNAEQSDEVGWGEEVNIGLFWIKLIHSNEWNDEAYDDPRGKVPFAEQPTGVPELTLEILNSAKQRRYIPIEEDLTLLGSAPNCHLRLKGGNISRNHCSLVRTPQGLWGVDLLSRGGIRLNDKRIRCGQLQDGDLLQVGKFQIRVHYDACRNVTRKAKGLRYALTKSSPASMFPSSSSAASQPVETHDDFSEFMLQQPFESRALPTPPALDGDTQLAANDSVMPQQGVSESFVLSIVNQFCMMQQQMFQQSQQSMMMMVNILSSLHQDHMEMIREDLDRVHQITDELHKVRGELLQQQAASGPMSTPDDALDAVISSPDMEPTENVVADGNQAQDDVQGSATDGESGDIPPQTEDDPISMDTHAAGEAVGASTASPAAADTTVSAQRSADSTSVTSGRQSQDAHANQVHPNRSGVHTHAWLSNRLAMLEQERESSWQKIMRTLTGAEASGKKT